MTWRDRLSAMTGRLALANEAEANCLAHYVSIPGGHVEIGCLWGGTAIIAAMAKHDAGVGGAIYTIDPMRGGWWMDKDPVVKLQPTPGAVLDNFVLFGVAHRIHIIRAKSGPWPLDGINRPASIFIDGDHNRDAVISDWRNASRTAQKYILAHDYRSGKHPGVQQAIDEIAVHDPDWQLREIVNTMAVFERVDHDD